MEEEEKVLREPGEKTREEDLRPAAEKPREETHGHGHHDHIEQDHDRDPDGHGHHHSHDHAHHHGDGEEEESEKGRWILIGFALAVFLAAFFVPEGILRIGMFLAAWLLAGFSVLKEAFLGLIHGELLDEAFLMAVAGIGAIAIGEFPEAAAVMLFYQVGEGLQDLAVQKSRKSIASMMAIRPETACVVRDGQEAAVKPEEVAVGEIIAVRPGERIPLDGVVTEGESELDLSALTGENLPKSVGPDDEVPGGGVVRSGRLFVRVLRPYGESMVARILEMVEHSAEKKAKTEAFITRFARIYTPCVVGAAVLIALIPSLITGDFQTWIYRALTFLVVSCPCALVISVPLAFFGGIGGAAREGILIKGANLFDPLSRITTAVFDKTGTLTEGSFEVTVIHPKTVPEGVLLDLAAAAESYSTHPIAESIVRAHGGHIDRGRIGGVKELAGLGVEAEIDGKTVYVGNAKLMEARGIVWKDECRHIGSVVHIAAENEYLGHVVISDTIKKNAGEALSSLRKQGVQTIVMLTGDSRAAADEVAEKLGIGHVHAELLPDEKVKKVEELLGKGETVAFAGDGINDAPVIMRADVGFAMGALGSDAAREAADVVLTDDNPGKIAKAIRGAKRTMRIARENVAFALLVKLLVLLLSAFGITGMWMAVFADVGVALLCVLNALRTMKIR